ncbi:hypothetical protein [Actinomadura luteofluorescens]|uniref:hypothetical protein n=1 Tax=Actinomadura luteofluorescens TaxID=46163 RepID=UPI003D9261A8
MGDSVGLSHVRLEVEGVPELLEKVGVIGTEGGRRSPEGVERCLQRVCFEGSEQCGYGGGLLGEVVDLPTGKCDRRARHPLVGPQPRPDPFHVIEGRR